MKLCGAFRDGDHVPEFLFEADIKAALITRSLAKHIKKFNALSFFLSSSLAKLFQEDVLMHSSEFFEMISTFI